VREKSERPKLQLHHRPIEIGRKFLVANHEWRQSAVRSVSIRDGLIAAYKDRKVRIRIAGDIGTVAIKGPRIGIVRPEFEYQIPIADAERMPSIICQDDTLRSSLFFVEDGGQRRMSTFTAAFSQVSLLPKLSSSKKTKS
jgi:CYTH domain-containing protein